MPNCFMHNALYLSISFFLFNSSLAFAAQSASQDDAEKPVTRLDTIVVTAEEQVKQSLGVSKVTAEDLEKTPVVNDISEILRRMPGVNLTGNSSSGERGNQRQIDIRGMGPENTLILVDGKPVNSRNSVRYGWRGERDTRGDSNWVPSEAIESIEVLRGPAAARYGSGAMGGVVNIVTKKISNETSGSVEAYTNQPENSKEGSSSRVGFNLTGPIIKDVLSYRVYGNYNDTQGDAADINPLTTVTLLDGSTSTARAAGHEGVENRDVSARLAWQMTDHQVLLLDASYGRQGNDYAGDTQNSGNDAATTSSSANALLNSLIGTETNVIRRDSYALTHEGEWSWGKTQLIAQYDATDNTRLSEGLAGGGEGRISNLLFSTSELRTTRLNGEANIPLTLYVPQNLTVGAEWVEDDFTDTANTAQGTTSYAPLLVSGNRTNMTSRIASAYLEDNLHVTDNTNVVLTLRFDDHNKSGSEWSPGLNLTHRINENWTVKGGIAKAYKAPNMYQNAEGYLLNTGGNGCPIGYSSCILQGNGDLKPETSVNKEVGIQFEKGMVNASAAWFRNDYENKIQAGLEPVAQITVNSTTYNLLRWENVPDALVEGVEGSISLDFGNANWTNNVTYMIESKNKSTGNPLSVIPKYTINSIFNYDITDKFDSNFVFTMYGRQKPRQYAESNIQANSLTATKTESIASYVIVGINFGYQLNQNWSGRIGVSNLFDEQLLRVNGTAQSYNERGRAYYASLKYKF